MTSPDTPLLASDQPVPPPPPDAPSAGTVSRSKRVAQFLCKLFDSSSNNNTVSKSLVQISVKVAPHQPSSHGAADPSATGAATTTTTTTTSTAATEAVEGDETEDKISDRVRVVFLSDFHYNGAEGGPATSGGNFVCASGELLTEVVRAVNSADADVIIFGGDFVDADGTRFAKELADTYLRKMRARHGKYAVLGNHDQFMPGSRDAVISALRSAGIHVLDNASVRPLPMLEIVGVGDSTTNGDFNPSKAFGSLADAETPPSVSIPVDKSSDGVLKGARAVGGLPARNARLMSRCRIVVTHNPDAAPHLMVYPAHIVLAGHTHGGQVCLPGSRRKPMAAWVYEDSCGCCCCASSWLKRKAWPIYRSFSHWEWAHGLHLLLNHEDAAQGLESPDTQRFLFVTNGIGSHSPGRFLCPPEVSIIDIDLRVSTPKIG